jgi:hypothetical protein
MSSPKLADSNYAWFKNAAGRPTRRPAASLAYGQLATVCAPLQRADWNTTLLIGERLPTSSNMKMAK